LTIFKDSIIFCGSCGRNENWLELKAKTAKAISNLVTSLLKSVIRFVGCELNLSKGS